MSDRRSIREVYSEYARGRLSLADLEKIAQRKMRDYERSREQLVEPPATTGAQEAASR